MKYKLLALDVDGTLVGADSTVAPETARAVAAADAAGLRVCLATGRSFGESAGIWRQLGLSPPFEPIIGIGGALVSEPDTGRTLYQRSIPPDVAAALADAIGDAGYCAMAIVDGWRHGVDYLLSTRGDLTAASRMWFSKMDVRVRRVERLSEWPGRPGALRISAVAEDRAARELAEILRARFDGQLTINALLAPNYDVMIVEAHARGVDKFAALRYVAQAHRISPRGIVAVGDDVNDLPMIRGAGLSVAMAGAPDSLKAEADVVASDGLASFLDDLLAGRFD